MLGKLVTIIQARMGSSRLPGKVLMPVLDEPILGHILSRLSTVDKVNTIMVATSDRDIDDPIAEYCSAKGISCFRGSENDVLDRFYQAATAACANTVIRITGDCPLVDPALISRLIDYYEANDLDYCGIATGAGVAEEGFKGRFPDGLDAEIFKMEILQTAWQEAREPLFREHVTPFIWKQPQRFNLGTLKSPDQDYSHLRWTVDNQEDYEIIRWVYEELYPVKPNFNMQDVLSLFERHPEKIEDNRQFIGQEGYEKFWQ